MKGTIESEFVRQVLVGASVVPFRLIGEAQSIIPWDGSRLIPEDDAALDLYPGLAQWWRAADQAWVDGRSSEKLSLLDRLNYHNELAAQFPLSSKRIFYGRSGMHVVAAYLSLIHI